jgi:hypothetical protein
MRLELGDATRLGNSLRNSVPQAPRTFNPPEVEVKWGEDDLDSGTTS